MPALFRTVRFKLAAAYVVTFAIVLLLLAVTAQVLLKRQMRQYFDSELIARAQQMVATLVQSPNPLTDEGLEAVTDDETQSVYFRNFYVQLRDLDGHVIARSSNLQGFQLPFDATPFQTDPRARVMETIDANQLEVITSENATLRMVAMRFESPGVKPFYLQVATSLEHVDASIALLNQLFWWGVPLTMLAAVAAAWLVSVRAVRRLEDVAAAARELTPETLEGRQMPTDDTGDEIAELTASIDRMLERLNEGFKAQRRFIHDASHELKTPLAIINSEAQVQLMGSNADDEARRFARSVADEAHHLGRLVDGLLTLTSSEGREQPLRSAPVSLNDAVVSAVQENQPLAEAHAVEFHVQLPMPDEDDDDADCDPVIEGDGELLTAMVSNLLRNAIRFSPRGQRVALRVECGRDTIRIHVRDHGPGIPPEAIESVFDRFNRGSSAGDRRGTGLGLTIARTVARLHGGDITASPPRNGTGGNFCVRLPRHRDAPH